MMTTHSLVGRSRELADLETALESAIQGRGSTFLVSGEAGIGKTRLAEELAHIARERGAAVFWGRACEVEGALPCWPWIQVLGACVRTESGAAFMKESPQAGDLGPLLQPDRFTPAFDNPELESLRLARAIIALLQHISKEQPVVLLFDDLHASDLATLTLMEIVARELGALRVLAFGAYREHEARRIPRKSALLSRLGREGALRPLGRLDEGAVAQLLARALGVEPTPALAKRVFATTEGNPLFVDALSQLLASRGCGASCPCSFGLPDTIRETVRELLQQLSPDARNVIDAASVLGRECTVSLLQLVSGAPADRVLAAIDEGIAAGVLGAQALPSHPVCFAHVLIREALYRELPASRRIELHRNAARALARLHATDVDAHLAELAHHSFESAPIDSWLSAADFSARAARHAACMFAFDDAAHHFERALVALDHAESTDDARRADLLWRLGWSQIHGGQSETGRETCERSAALALRIGDGETYARAALAAGSEPTFGRADARLANLLRQALQLGTGNEAMRARVMARLAAAMDPASSPSREEARRLARDAIAIARVSADRRALAKVLSAARGAFITLDALDERVALDRELAAIAAALGDKLLELEAHGQLAIDAMENADAATARAELRIQQRLADETRVPQHRLRAACARLMWATLIGNANDIALAEREVREIPERADGVPGLVIIEANRCTRATMQGDIPARMAAAAAAAEQWLADVPPAARMGRVSGLPLLPLWRAIALDPHRQIEMRAKLAQFAPDGPNIGMGPVLLAWVAPVLIHLGDRTWVQTAYDSLLPFAARDPVLLSRFFPIGPVSYYLGCLAAALGHREKAAEHFHETLRLAQRAGFIDCEASTRRALDALGRSPISPSRPSRPETSPRLIRGGEFWTLRHDGREVRLKHSKGIQYLATLLREPGREFHVSDLVNLMSDADVADEDALRQEGLQIGNSSDAGEWIDARAKATYRQKLEALADALEDAEARGDGETAARIRHEREALGAELSRALGLGSRARKAGSTSERSRINVQRRIRDVLERVSESDPTLGRHLEFHIKTGVFCSWRP